MLQIYYGMGKGKTSALNGAATRAVGANFRVGIFRFLKGRHTSEDDVLRKLGIDVMKIHSSTKFVLEMNGEEKIEARNKIKNGLDYITMNQHKYDVILMDEFLDLAAQTVNFFSEEYLINYLNKLDKKIEIILTGHNEYSKLFEHADLVTHMVADKHYFDAGVKARKGFEF